MQIIRVTVLRSDMPSLIFCVMLVPRLIFIKSYSRLTCIP